MATVKRSLNTPQNGTVQAAPSFAVPSRRSAVVAGMPDDRAAVVSFAEVQFPSIEARTATPNKVAVQTTLNARTLTPNKVAVSGASANTVPAHAAIQTVLNPRTLTPTKAAIQTAGIARTVPATVGVGDPARKAIVSFAEFSTPSIASRTLTPNTVAIQTLGARTVPTAGAVQTTSARTVAAHAVVSTDNRAVVSFAELQTPGIHARTVPATAAIRTTTGRPLTTTR